MPRAPRQPLSFACLALALLAGCVGNGPAGPIPGGSLRGVAESATAEADWSDLAAADSVDVEISGDAPRSVRTGFVVYEGQPHLPVTWAPLKRWPDVVRRHPRVLVRIAEDIFAFEAHEVIDAERLERLRKAGQAKYGAPFHARSLNDSTFYFRLDPVGLK